MSGIGEALAIVSCVAGLIQAYDAASRRIEKIKKRRAQRNAPAPPVHLERSVERGKQQIEEIVEEGKERFGEDFEHGDGEVQIQLMRITIATQAAMLKALADADENSVDFWDCIEASDAGRRRALAVLNDYIERKTKEERLRANSQNSAIPEIPATQMPETQPQQASGSLPGVQRVNTFPLSQQIPSSPAQDTPRSKFFPFPRSSSTTVDPQPVQQNRPVPVPVQSNEASLNITGARSWSTQATGKGTSSQRQSTSTTNTSISSITSPDSPFESANVSASTIRPLTIASHGGCCKYAHYLRDGKTDQSLRRQTYFVQGGQAINFICRSSKCKFQVPALEDRSHNWRMDTRPRAWGGRMQYTPIFLAKSHVPMEAPLHEQSTKALYRCIICLFSQEEAGIFHGHDALLEHVHGHAGANWDDVKLEGPLCFDNKGISSSSDFDLNLPKLPPAETEQRHSTWSTIGIADPSSNDEELQHELELETGSRRSSHVSRDTDPYYSPWD